MAYIDTRPEWIREESAREKRQVIRYYQQVAINEAIDGTLKIQVKWMERFSSKGRELFQIAIGPYEAMKCIFGRGSIELKQHSMSEGEHRISELPEWQSWRRTHDPERARDVCNPKPIDPAHDLSTRDVWYEMRGVRRDDTR